ncbi:MAG TPA: HDOD domain-containing protein [Planctomycetes bacterium]|nr:HDOD domain-containing protein [Planctomycetota bacterium]
MPARILETHRQLFSDLPAVPKILHRLRSMLADPEIPLEAVGARIAADQALAEGFLSMRRLPFFGTVSALDRVEECVLVLGRDKTRTLLGILEAYRLVETSDQDVLQLKSLVWRHGLAVAEAAVAIAVGSLCDSLGGVPDVRALDRVFTWGLIHDIGRLLMLRHGPGDVLEIEKEIRLRGGSRLELERDVFGFSHDELGAAFLLTWGFDEETVLAVRKHHTIDDQSPDELTWLHLGEVAVMRLAGEEAHPKEGLLEWLGFTWDDVRGWVRGGVPSGTPPGEGLVT